MLSILSYLRSGDYLQAIIVILSRCFVVFCCLPVHELAHGLVANKLGDDTAKNQGRLTLNPFAHLNPIGALMIFLFGIGYAQAVPINPRNFKNPKRGMALTALAGPVSNLLMAFVYIFIYVAIEKCSSDTVIADSICYFFYFAALVNVTLAVFNLFPIPPLDGAKVLGAILPAEKYFKYMQYERYIMIGLFVLLFTGLLDTPISYLTSYIFRFLSILPRFIFSFI